MLRPSAQGDENSTTKELQGVVCCPPRSHLSRMRAAIFVVVSAIAYSTLAAAGELQRHTFTAANHIITMEVGFNKPYVGTPLVFYDDGDPLKPMCFTGNGENGACPGRFVGAVVLVTFTVKSVGGKLRTKSWIREHVTVTAQSPDLPPRPPFDKTQVVTNGTITDIEAFGYDESEIVEGEREVKREKSRKQLWRLCRQELYLNDETVPFAVIHWRYTLDAIKIVRLQSGLLIDPPVHIGTDNSWESTWTAPRF